MTPDGRGTATRKYNAFISYSHTEDLRLAGSIQSALQRFARPWYKTYALRIFRDKTSLAANPALWGSVARALDDSEYLLLLASPAARASAWVPREVEAFVTTHEPAKVLIALTRGVITWDAAARDFDWTITTALPDCLRGRFQDQPLYVDLSWVDKREQLSLRNAGFRSAILDLAAPLHGRPRDDLDSDDLRQHRRTLRLAWSAIVLLATLSVALGLAAFYANRQRNEATRQTAIAEGQRRVAEDERRIAVSRQLAAQARDRLSTRLDLALLQSVQATVMGDTDEARSSLLAALFYSPHLRKFLWDEPITVKAAAFSGDGRTLIELADDQQTIRLRSFNSNGIRALGHFADVHDIRSLAMSRDASRFALATPGRIVIRNGKTGAALSELRAGLEDREPASVLAFSADGKMLAGYRSSGVTMWNVDGRTLPRGPLLPKRWETALAFSPDGSRLASGGNDGSIVIWDARSGQAIGSPLLGHRRKIFSLAFSPDGSLLASGSEDRTIRLWNTATRTLVHEPLVGHEPWPIGFETWGLTVTFSHDGLVLASAAKDGSVMLWDVGTGERLDSPLRGHPSGVVSAAFGGSAESGSRTDGISLVSVGQDGTVLEWATDPASAAAAALAGHGEGVLNLAFSRDGRTLAAASLDGIVNLWSVDAGRLLHPPLRGFRSAVLEVAVSHDGATLLAATKEELIDRPLDAGAAHAQRFPAHAGPVSRVAFAPDGETAASSDGVTLVVWNHVNHTFAQLPITSASPGHEVRSLVFSPDGRLLASGGADGTLAFWDIGSRQLLRPAVTAHREAVYALAFSPDGQTLASSAVGTADYDADVRLWSVATGAQLPPALSGHDGPVGALAFSRDGTMLAAGVSERIVLWQLERRQRIGQSLTGHSGPIEALAFSPDGHWLASGAYDDRVLLWDLRPDSWRRLACGIANRRLDRTEWAHLVGGYPYEPACR